MSKKSGKKKNKSSVFWMFLLICVTVLSVFYIISRADSSIKIKDFLQKDVVKLNVYNHKSKKWSVITEKSKIIEFSNIIDSIKVSTEQWEKPQVDYEIICDLGSEGELVIWFPSFKMAGQSKTTPVYKIDNQEAVMDKLVKLIE